MITCHYCGKPAELVGGDTIYPHRPDLAEKKFWNCTPCKAYVGCHPGTENPLGRLADAELRQAKMAAHAAFDPIWKEGRTYRRDAYAWLAQALNLTPDECHIGMFDKEGCQRVVEVCRLRDEPKPLENPDWSKVIQTCQEHIKEYIEGTQVDSDLPHYVYEATMVAVFGPDVWKWMQFIRSQPPTK
jgi:hypothetical protein